MSKKRKIIILVLTMFIYVPLVFAAINYSSSNVVVDNRASSITSPYLQGAIDEIDYFCSKNSPKEYMCKKNTPICRRATTLHTEECIQANGYHCAAQGYTEEGSMGTTMITYGNQTTTSGVLTVGDAFDCDVNGDGTYDSSTERFYYISDYYDTDRMTFNDKVAVLVYYSNTTAGVASTTNTAYNSCSINHEGPVTAAENLPTTSQWSNIRLYNNMRQILTRDNSKLAGGIDLPIRFNYTQYSARLLTFQELYHNCQSDNDGDLDSNSQYICRFLSEHTEYSNSSTKVKGTWLENPDSQTTNKVFMVQGSGFSSYALSASISGYGVRPVIEVLKADISY